MLMTMMIYHFKRYGMKELIEKIEVNEEIVKNSAFWLSQSRFNGLNGASETQVIRYLLKKVTELEEEIKNLKNTIENEQKS